MSNPDGKLAKEIKLGIGDVINFGNNHFKLQFIKISVLIIIVVTFKNYKLLLYNLMIFQFYLLGTLQNLIYPIKIHSSKFLANVTPHGSSFLIKTA